jgi:hypothetical protein
MDCRDKNRRRPDDDDYDCTTLYVPEAFLRDQTVSCCTLLHTLTL